MLATLTFKHFLLLIYFLKNKYIFLNIINLQGNRIDFLKRKKKMNQS